MTIKDKVHVTIGIKRGYFKETNKLEDITYIRTVLKINHEQSEAIYWKIRNQSELSQDYKVKIKMSYEQLGRYTANRRLLEKRAYWLWPDVLAIEVPTPKTPKILDISEEL